MKPRPPHLKLILLALLVLGIVALFVFTDKLSPEFIIAGIAYFIATLQAKLFGNQQTDEQGIRKKHKAKQMEWDARSEEFDTRSLLIEEKLQAAREKTIILQSQLDSLRGQGVRTPLSEDEILKRLEKL